MIGLPSLRTIDGAQVSRIWLAAEPTDMRCSFDRLAERVRTVIGQDPLGNGLFVFRSRSGDIYALSDAFLDEIGRLFGRPPAGLTREAKEALVKYHWPGNVREIRNFVEGVFIDPPGSGELIGVRHIPTAFRYLHQMYTRSGEDEQPRSLSHASPPGGKVRDY